MTKVMLLQSRNVVNSSGGAEHVFCELSSALADKGYEVVAVCNETKKGKPFYPLSSAVKFVNLGERKSLSDYVKKLVLPWLPNLTFAKFIKKEKPDVIICFFLKDLVNVSLHQKYNVPIILMQHCFPDFYFNKIKPSKEKLYKKLVESCAYVQVLLPSFAQQVTNRYNVKTKVISNYVKQNIVPSDLTKEKAKIVYVAKIVKSKGQHLLVQSFAKIAGDFPNWMIELSGGPRKKKNRISSL